MGQELRLEHGAEPFPGYRLGQRIGQGGFAEVWDAIKSDGTRVALKFMPMKNSLAASKEIRSIQDLSKLIHPNLIRIDHVWALAGYIILVMELADGSMLDLLHAYQSEYRTNVPPDEICRYLLMAASALDFLNARHHYRDGSKVSYQHCDVKPNNLLLCNDVVKLADYGLATPLNSAMIGYSGGGTIDFAPPEVFRGQLSERSDQFALAVTYFLLRTGQLPHPNPPKSFDRNYIHPSPDLSLLTAPERPILARALSPLPYSRWPTCTSLIQQLARLFEPIDPGAEFDTTPDF